MPAGRPTTYSEVMLQKTQEYIELCQDDPEKKKVNIPTIEGLAVYLKVNKTTVYEWESSHSEYSNVISTLRSEQASRLVNNGLAGTYNPTIAKVLLTKHGYRDAVDTDMTTKGDKIGSTITDEVLIEASEKLREKMLKGETK